jgi:hypothetical protein
MDEYLHDAVLSAPPEWMFEPRDDHIILTASFPRNAECAIGGGGVDGGGGSSGIAPQFSDSAGRMMHAPPRITEDTLAENELSPWIHGRQQVPEAATELLLL